MMDSLNPDQNIPGSTSTQSTQPTPGKPLRLTYGSEREELQFGDLHLPDSPGPHPTVILIHGGFWRARHGLDLMTALADDLSGRGIAAWNIEYRRVGDSDGGWPTTLLDVAQAADHLRTLAPTYNLDLNRVVTIGHSAGGHLAFWLAGRPHIPKDSPLASADTPLPLAGAISLAGVVDLHLTWQLNLSNGAVAELLGGSPDEVSERYEAASPAALLPLGIPQVLIHGTEDDSVPLQVSQVYAAAAGVAGDKVTLIELQGADHFVLIDIKSAAWARTVEELQKLLAL